MDNKRYRLTVEFTATDDAAAREIADRLDGTYMGMGDAQIAVVPDSLQYEVTYFTSLPQRRPELEVAS